MNSAKSIAIAATLGGVGGLALAIEVHAGGGRSQKTPILLQGQSATLTIAEPGTYDYICGLHPSIKGKIVVK